MKNVFCYVRVSSAEQANEGYSIEEQTKRLEKYCESYGWTILQVFTDAGFTGANMNRPALQEMISEVKKGNADCVVVWKLDRLSRSQKDTLILIDDIFLANNTDFVSMTENFDTSSPFGRAMIGILAVFAQLEREKIKERTQMGREARANEGKWKGGITPIGYDYFDDYLTINDFQAMIVKDLFENYTSGMTMSKVVKRFNALYGSNFNANNLRNILSNKTYLGFLRHKNEWVKSYHEPIIDEQTFQEAQIRLKRDYERTVHERKMPSTMLGGLLFCAHCGARYSKSLSGSAKYGKHEVYSCYSRNKKAKHMMRSDSCKNKIWRVSDLDEIILNEVKKLSFEPIVKPSKPEIDTKSIESKIESIDKQISRLIDLYSLSRFSASALEQKIVPLEEQKHQLMIQLQEEPKKDYSPIIESIPAILEKGDSEQIRFIVHELIDRIVIDGENIEIHWSFS